MKVNHILEKDYGTHLVTYCGRFPKTVEEVMDGRGVCKLCKIKFIRTPEAIKKEFNELVAMGERLFKEVKNENSR